MASKAYAAHEQATAGAVMLIKMVLGAALSGLLVGLLTLWIGVDRIDARFAARGFPPGSIRSFLVNHHLLVKIPLPLSMDTPPQFADFMPLPSVLRREYNRLLHLRFQQARSGRLLEQAVADSHRLGVLALILFLLTGAAYYLFFACKSKKIQRESHVKGARLLSGEQFSARIDRIWPDPQSLTIGSIRFPRSRESFHSLVYGASGSGKSTLLNQLLAALLARQSRLNLNEKFIVYDVKGEYLAKHYTPERGDAVFFPFDARSLRWRLFNELLAVDGRSLDRAMVDVVSAILCSPPSQKESKNEYFYTAAAEVLRAVFLILHARGTLLNGDLAAMLGLGRTELAGLVRDYLPQAEWSVLEHLEAAEQAAGVLGVLNNQMRFLRYLHGLDGDFSLRGFIDGQESAVLFLMNLPRLAEIFRPLLTFAIDLMIRHALSLPDCTERRIRFFIDELGSLGKIDSLLRFLTLSRSKGGCLYVSNQEEGSIRELYGDKLSESFNNNFASLMVFRQNDEKSAASMSKQLGEQEVIKRSESHSFSPSSMGDRLSVGDQQKRETLISYSQLQHLADLEFYYRLAGVGTALFRVPAVFLAERHAHHCERPGATVPASLDICAVDS